MDTAVFVLRTELQIVNALNIIDQQSTLTRKICVLLGRVATNYYQNSLQKLSLFESIYKIDFQRPLLIYWLRSTKAKECYSILDIIKAVIFKKEQEIIKKILKIYCKNIFDHLKNSENIFFYNYDVFTKCFLTQANPNIKIHLIDEGIGSYLKTPIPINQIDDIYLYDPSLALYRHSAPDLKFKAINKLNTKRNNLLKQLNILFPSKDPIISTKIFLDQPVGQQHSYFKYFISSHYRNKILAHKAKLTVINTLLTNITGITIRKHPDIKTKSTPAATSGNRPFEFELIDTNINEIELYTLYSTASCYWRLMLCDEILKNKKIIVHVLYPSMRKIFPLAAGTKKDKLIISFFELLSNKFPSTFILE